MLIYHLELHRFAYYFGYLPMVYPRIIVLVSCCGAAAAPAWPLQEFVDQYMPQFRSCERNGLVTGAAAKGVMGSSGLPVAQLRKIWELSDIDKDGSLDMNEFVIAMYLIDQAKAGTAPPSRLDDDLIPPGKSR